MGTGRGAAVGVVAKGVDVESSLGVGVETSQVIGNLGIRGLVLLLEDDGAGHLGVATQNADYDARKRTLASVALSVFGWCIACPSITRPRQVTAIWEEKKKKKKKYWFEPRRKRNTRSKSSEFGTLG